MNDQSTLTALIHKAMDGDGDAHAAVFEATYDELKKLAHRRVSQSGRDGELNTTGLVHESYLRFVKAGRITIEDRQHFLGYAGRVMRSVIIDAVRERMAQRRGGDIVHVTLNTAFGDGVPTGEGEVLAVHEALEQLADVDGRLVKVVEMRYFAGMTDVEIAEALGVTDRTVRRIWERARLWLANALQ
jgi:RNA polymerase sigma factor (TIGR02999 family)